jgi:hypothetical protein
MTARSDVHRAPHEIGPRERFRGLTFFKGAQLTPIDEPRSRGTSDGRGVDGLRDSLLSLGFSFQTSLRYYFQLAVSERQCDGRSGDGTVPHVRGGNHSGVLLFKKMFALTAQRFNNVGKKSSSFGGLRSSTSRRRKSQGPFPTHKLTATKQLR